MTGVAAAAICLGLSNCSRYDFTPISEGEQAYANYENAFIQKFGEPAPDQTWGFGGSSTKATRSASAPEVLKYANPYTDSWIQNYLESAKEVNKDNENHTNDGKSWVEAKEATFEWTQVCNILRYNFTYGDASSNGYTSEENKDFWTEWCAPYINGNYSKYGVSTQAEAILALKTKLDETNRSDWYSYTPATEAHWVADENYVLNYKITGTWNGKIGAIRLSVERTVVITGVWNISSTQSVGGGVKIIVAKGGTINIATGASLSTDNQGQLVVLPGGTITGLGSIAFCNGANIESPGYNGGTINVSSFNNNGGYFFNYGTLKANTMDGGAGNSRYYNHGIVNIGQTGSSANLRLYNACQFYCSGNMRIRNYEGVGGSSLICNGELMLCSSNDETGEPTYVGLAAGALVQCGTLNNNGKIGRAHV